VSDVVLDLDRAVLHRNIIVLVDESIFLADKLAHVLAWLRYDFQPLGVRFYLSD
jgi:hypothetical protein